VRGTAPQYIAELHGQNTVSDTMQKQKAESDKSCINSCERGEGTRNKKQKGRKRERERKEGKKGRAINLTFKDIV
jgi:hypothetical protein